ncbi:DUF1566 domain-containing protein [Vibrio vulnificus]|nr:DUF1566 domain-containing protein [Vibrio vulnificus]
MMLSNKIVKSLLFASLLTPTLYGCGGGDSGGDDSGQNSGEPQPEQRATLSAIVSSGGSITPQQITVEKGESVTFTVTAEEGFELSRIAGCDGQLAGNIYHVTAAKESCQISATFDPSQWKVTPVGFNGYSLDISSDGINWFSLVQEQKLSVANSQAFFVRLDNQVLSITCETLSCTVTPYTLLTTLISQGFSVDEMVQAKGLMSSVLGLTEDPFLNISPYLNVNEFNNWVSQTSLFNVLNAIASDSFDGYVDNPEVTAIFPSATLRTVQEIAVAVGELPTASEGETLQVFSLATESANTAQGSTSGYLSDYVLQSQTTDSETGEVTKDILYLAFNVGKWKGHLDAETHTLANLFILNPEWIMLPESEKEKVANNLSSNPLFTQAVELYTNLVVSNVIEETLNYQRLLEQIHPSIEVLTSNQRRMVARALSFEVEQQQFETSQQERRFNTFQPRSQAMQSSCVAAVKPRTLIDGVLFEQLTIGTNRTCDETVFGSRMAVWYGWSETSKLTQAQTIASELSSTQMIEPKSFTEILAKTSSISGISINKEYTLYKNHPEKFISKPEIYNTGRMASVVVKLVFGVTSEQGKGFGDKVHSVAVKANKIMKEYEAMLIGVEASLYYFQISLEIFTALDRDFEYYQDATTAIKNLSRTVENMRNILGDISQNTEVKPGSELSYQQLFELLKSGAKNKNIKDKSNSSISSLSLKYGLLYTYLNYLDNNDSKGDIKVLETTVRKKGLAYRLARYGLSSLSNKQREELDKELVIFSLSEVERKSIARLGGSQIKLALAILQKNKSHAKDVLDFVKDVTKLSNLSDVILFSLKNVSSASLHNKDELLKAVGWALVDGLVNNVSSNLVPALIKSLTPQKYAQLVLQGGEAAVILFDWAMKPGAIQYTAIACEENSKQVCLETMAPPLEIVPYLVAVDVEDRPNGVYLLDSSSGVMPQNLHDEASWPEEPVDYIAALPIRNNNESAALVLAGATLSYELDAFVSPTHFDEFEKFIDDMSVANRTLEFDWFVYPYKNTHWENVSAVVLPERNQSNALNGNYKKFTVETEQYDCDLNAIRWYNFKCKDVFIRAKNNELNNPMLKSFVRQSEERNAMQQGENKIDLNNLVFMSFTKANNKHKWPAYATFETPGVRNLSAHLKLGDATWKTDTNVYVVPDYSKEKNDLSSPQKNLELNSDLVVNEKSQILGLNVSVVDDFISDEIGYSVKSQLYYPVIEALNTQTNQLNYIYSNPVQLVTSDYVRLDTLPPHLKAKNVYFYDSIFHGYLKQVGGNFVTWLDTRSKQTHYAINVAKKSPVEKNRFAGQPYLKLNVDIEGAPFKKPIVRPSEPQKLPDADADGIPDQWDNYPNDSRYAFDSDGDGMADEWETRYGLDPYSNENLHGLGPNDDLDGDGLTNVAEFNKTLLLGAGFTGYDPTSKVAQWKAGTQTVLLSSKLNQPVLLTDWLLFDNDQVPVQAVLTSADLGEGLEMPTVRLSNDLQKLEFTMPDSWKDGQKATFHLALEFESGEYAISQLASGEFVDYLELLVTKAPKGENWVLGVEFGDSAFAHCVKQHAEQQKAQSLNALTTLSCRGASVIDVTELKYMTGLTKLDLSGNRLTTINLDANTALTRADLWDNPFTQATLDYLASVTWIEELNYLAPPKAQPTGKLNDTGIDWCANGSQNNLDCPVQGYEGQDGEHGRDALARKGQLQKVGGGAAGFDFTKLDNSGNPLPESASEWSCVRDNHTGLIWEVKQPGGSGGLRDANHTYSWYNPDNSTNGGSAGTQNGGICQGSACDTYAFVNTVNSQGLCGASDWRLPSVNELLSIVDNGRVEPAIEQSYFPYTPQYVWYWSSSPNSGNSGHAWYVYFGYGNAYYGNEGSNGCVRLVRAGQ